MVFQIRSQDPALFQINQQAVQLAELRRISFPQHAGRTGTQKGA
jgi:hypothetical protein